MRFVPITWRVPNQALPGRRASVNFAANTLSVTYHPSVISLQKMQEAVQAAGYDLVVEAEDPLAVQEEMARKHYKKLKRNTIGAWILSVPLALLGMVFMHMPYANWIMMVLALAIMVLFGRSFYVNGVPCAAKECQYGYFGGPQYFHCFYIQFLQYGLSAVLD